MTLLTACPSCNTGNRVGDGAPQAAKCGRCGAKLFTGVPIDVDDAALGAHLKVSSMPVLVDIWAPWCGPCRMMAPTFAAAAKEFEPRIRFLKLNADQNQAPAKLGVRGIPTLILFHEGREIDRQAGLISADQLNAWLTQARARVSSMESQS
ncbi:MAG: thioredoxin TrxC [Hyphomonadaceae bacterium JAD_PAG50586_4]|nr:MAG: thioredoxin TrxC [Hyphomonadaceae bacterium JAD_PAG50586_4]